MICQNCNKEDMYIRPTTKAYGKGDSLIVIENVPVEACHNCGTDLLSADTLDRLDWLKRQARNGALPMRRVYAANFNANPIAEAFKAGVASGIEQGQIAIISKLREAYAELWQPYVRLHLPQDMQSLAVKAMCKPIPHG